MHTCFDRKELWATSISESSSSANPEFCNDGVHFCIFFLGDRLKGVLVVTFCENFYVYQIHYSWKHAQLILYNIVNVMLLWSAMPILATRGINKIYLMKWNLTMIISLHISVFIWFLHKNCQFFCILPFFPGWPSYWWFRGGFVRFLHKKTHAHSHTCMSNIYIRYTHTHQSFLYTQFRSKYRSLPLLKVTEFSELNPPLPPEGGGVFALFLLDLIFHVRHTLMYLNKQHENSAKITDNFNYQCKFSYQWVTVYFHSKIIE